MGQGTSPSLSGSTSLIPTFRVLHPQLYYSFKDDENLILDVVLPALNSLQNLESSGTHNEKCTRRLEATRCSWSDKKHHIKKAPPRIDPKPLSNYRKKRGGPKLGFSRKGA